MCVGGYRGYASGDPSGGVLDLLARSTELWSTRQMTELMGLVGASHAQLIARARDKLCL